MVNLFRAVAASLATLATSAVLVQAMTSCSTDNPCPSSTPCCSSYGFCGVGAYCLGGCDPKSSFDLQSCMAVPVCKNADYKFTSLDGVSANTQYLGDASSADWVSSGSPVEYNNQGVLLTLAQGTSGTLLSSTHYVWYGKISAKMTTSQGAGVVTAFIMMSDMKDEIDVEFVGTDVDHAQSNYYFQGITDYDNELNISSSNTESTVHTYTVDWQQDYIQWLVDGNVLRTKFRNETYNSTSGQYHFPQTPSRVQLSLWPAGLSTNAQGTIDWAGGEIQWDSAYMSNGYYYALVKEVTVECYDPPSGYNNNGNKAYYYTSTAGTNDTVAIGNNNTILASFYASGNKPNYDPNASKSASASGTKTASAAASSSAEVETVPGDSGAGIRDGGSDSSSVSSAAAGSTATGSSTSSSGSSSNSFSQGSAPSDTNEGAKVVAGSLVAFVAFIAAALIL